MRRISTLAGCIGCLLVGCGSDCPGDELEVRPFTGDSIQGTSITCEGARVEDWFACQVAPEASVDLSAPPTGCGGGLRVRLGPGLLSGETPVIWLFGDAELVEARIQIEFGCDEQCQAPSPVHFLAGFVQAEEFSVSGRNRGRFDFEFDEGRMSGTYDVTIP